MVVIKDISFDQFGVIGWSGKLLSAKQEKYGFLNGCNFRYCFQI